MLAGNVVVVVELRSLLHECPLCILAKSAAYWLPSPQADWVAHLTGPGLDHPSVSDTCVCCQQSLASMTGCAHCAEYSLSDEITRQVLREALTAHCASVPSAGKASSATAQRVCCHVGVAATFGTASQGLASASQFSTWHVNVISSVLLQIDHAVDVIGGGHIHGAPVTQQNSSAVVRDAPGRPCLVPSKNKLYCCFKMFQTLVVCVAAGLPTIKASTCSPKLSNVYTPRGLLHLIAHEHTGALSTSSRGTAGYKACHSLCRPLVTSEQCVMFRTRLSRSSRGRNAIWTPQAAY
jgi:hypothetical protein